MALRFASHSRSSFVSIARASPLRSTPPHTRLRPPSLSASPQQRRRFSFSNPRRMGSLGCAQSLLPLQGVVANSRLISHLAWCELSLGWSGKDG